LPPTSAFRARGGRNLEFTLPELAQIGRDRTQPEPLRDTSRAAFHFRITEVVSMFLLPMLALALGVPPKRSSSALGVFLSIVIIVTYFKVNEYGEGIGGLGRVDPFIALWVPFAIFAGLVLWMFHTIAFVPGGQPIGALERVFAKISKVVVRWLPFRRERRNGDDDAPEAQPV
jgi:lipopolysaccharide export system permease protein